MKTLDEEETSATTLDQFAKKTKISLSVPTEIIENILCSLPVKSILRFRSVCKPWLSIISDPSFTELHITRATVSPRTALFISVYDQSTYKRHLLSAARDGGPVTHLMTLDGHRYSSKTIEAEHLNGLILFTCNNWFYYGDYHFVLNPSTHKVFELPKHDSLTNCGYNFNRYLFGFDESRNEHKILNIREVIHTGSHTIVTMIFCMSSYSWRKIDAEPPIGVNWVFECYRGRGSVCVNSVVHLMLQGSFDILAFDLRTEKFSIISTLQCVMPYGFDTEYEPCIIKINGRIGVARHDRVVEDNKMHIWILQDYENRVWVREIVAFPEPGIDLNCPFLFDGVSMDEIMFSSSKVSENVMSVPVYNRKSKCFKTLQFTFDHQFLCPKTLKLNLIKCYVESMLPL